MPYLIIGAALLLLVLFGKGSGMASQSSTSKSSGAAGALALLASAKKLLPAGGTAAVVAGGVVAGGSVIGLTEIPAAGSLFASVGPGAIAPSLELSDPVFAALDSGSGAVVPGGAAASGGIGAALATAGLLAAPFVLGPTIAKLIGGKTFKEWEAEQAAERAANIEAEKAFAEIQARDALIANYESGTSKPVAKPGGVIGG